MTTPQSDTPQHGLTVSVYRVDPETGDRTSVQEQRFLPADETPVMHLAFPPCACPRCR
ncbi:hypothetical protein [Streptomyces zhihengii]|uniref:hypothetical protein n=1 Tax=Streptomyces zhihengii TaxID=1818004 RepID=UPI0033AE9DB1